METMSDTIYQGQEFFRIIHEGERAGLYRVEMLPTGKEEATLLGAPLIVKVVADAAGDGRALAMEWLDPNGTHSPCRKRCLAGGGSGPSSGGWFAAGGGASCWGENPY